MNLRTIAAVTGGVVISPARHAGVDACIEEFRASIDALDDIAKRLRRDFDTLVSTYESSLEGSPVDLLTAIGKFHDTATNHEIVNPDLFVIANALTTQMRKYMNYYTSFISHGTTPPKEAQC